MSTVGSKKSGSALLHGLQLEFSAEEVCMQLSVPYCSELPVSSRFLAKTLLKLLTPRANHDWPESHWGIEGLGCQLTNSLCFQRESQFCELFASLETMFLFHAFRFTLTSLSPRTRGGLYGIDRFRVRRIKSPSPEGCEHPGLWIFSSVLFLWLSTWLSMDFSFMGIPGKRQSS